VSTRTWIRTYFVLFIALVSAAAADGPRVYTSTQHLGPYELDSDRLQQMPAGILPIAFDEPVWVVGYSTAVVDSDGNRLSNELHCHTMLMTPMTGHPVKGQPFKGFFSDGYTTEMILPQGFGLFFDQSEQLELMPMFNNRDEKGLPAGMDIAVNFVRNEELPEPLTPLYTRIAAIDDSGLYMVGEGEDVREMEFTFHHKGSIHAMGAHIHPYGRSIALIHKASGKTIWESVGKVGQDQKLIEMPTFSSPEGYAFEPGDPYLVRAKYYNPTDIEQDAMAGLFIFFSTEDGEIPVVH